MQLLFYASKNDKNENRLEAAIRTAAPGESIEHFTGLTELRERLRSIVEPDSVMVLAAVDRSELKKMRAFRGMLTEIFIILVLPDREKSTIHMAHQLRPRFISQLEDDFDELNQVITKMIQSPHGPPPPKGAQKRLPYQVQAQKETMNDTDLGDSDTPGKNNSLAK